MIPFDDPRELVGMSCSLHYPWRGYTEGEIIEEYAEEVLVRMTSGAEIAVHRSDISLC